MVKTITLQVNIPTDRMLQITLPPDVPDGLVEMVLVIAPISLPEQKTLTDQDRYTARNILMTMHERATPSYPSEPTDLAANHDHYLYGD